MHFRLSDEQRMLLETVRELAQREFRPKAKQYLDGSFPRENLQKLAELGVLGMAVPKEYGGMGMGVLETALVLEEIAKACYVTAMAVLGEVGVQTRIIATFAPEQLKQRYLPKIARGELILSICITEPDSGTDVASMTTNTRIEGDTAVIQGVKTLISRAEVADLFVVFTRVNGVPGGEGIGCVLVERGTPGLVAEPRYHTMGGEYLSEVRFEECAVPAEHVVLQRDGVRKLMNAFNVQRCLNAAICLGLAEGAVEESIRHMRERRQFGRPIGDFQGLQWKLVDMYKEVEAARGLLYRACMSGSGFPDPMQAALAKIYCNEMAIKVTSDAIQIHGGYGYTDEYAVSRHFRGARFGSVGGGTTETLRNLVARRLLRETDLKRGLVSLDTF